MKKWLPWVLGAGALVLLYYLFSGAGSSSSSGYTVATPQAPDTSASDAARYGFLSSGIGALVQLEESITANQYQLAAIENTNAAQVSAAEQQAQAAEAAARASTVGHHGLNLGPISFTW